MAWQLSTLSMAEVSAHLADHLEPLPRDRQPIDLPETDVERQRIRLLRAHEFLADLSDENFPQFAGVVDSLRLEIDEDGHAQPTERR